MQVKQNRFGDTGLTVPQVIYGGGWVGGLLIRADEEVREAVLDKAYAAGIDWVDTAAAYGDGVSETVIGQWLAKRPVDKRPRISTKFGVDITRGDFKDQMLRSVEASLERLGRDKVELIYLHNRIVKADRDRDDARTNTLDEMLGRGGAADVMDDLKVRGLCDFTGITALGQPDAVKSVVEHKRFDAAQVYYNMINPTAAGNSAGRGWNTTDFGGLLEACASAGMGVMGIRIFAAGHLATTERHGREVPITSNTESEAEEARAKAVQQVTRDDYGTPAETALRFGLACPLLSGIVVGIGEPDHLDQVLNAVDNGPLPDDVVAALDEVRGKDPAFRS
jgi:aryl-alcohol dehydrogenase-like predicted oxidoreductase